MDKKHIIKFTALVLFLLLVVYFFRFSGYTENLNFESIKLFVESFGALSFVAFVVLYALLTTVSVPGIILTFTGAVLFGTLKGTLFNLIGATLGAGLSFFTARYLGRNFVENLLKGKLKQLDQTICNNAFSGILFVRLIPLFPFVGINFGSGLCKISFKDYITATFVGMIPGTFVYTYLFATLGEKVLTEGIKLADISTLEVLTPIILFILLMTVPIMYKRFKK